MVYLVGAGPGDSGLITQKGLECIKKADVIIYDHLANPTLLSYAKNDCKLIYAGKSQAIITWYRRKSTKPLLNTAV